jgi:two-component system, chemotaxis family, chemotaxis protein CheY
MLLPDRLKALIVDDNAYARAATAATLRKLGLKQIVETETAQEALLTLAAEPFDVLFMDWYIPEMSGAALLQIIRDPRFGANGHLPVVLMTAYPSREVLTRARELGISDALAKPFTAAHVSAVLQRVLAGWQIPDDDPLPKAAGDDAVFL